MTSISLESDIRRRPIIPTHLISAFLEQATAHGSRSTALRLVAGLLLISVAGTVVAAYVKTPFWIVTLFTVFAAFAASLYLTTYVYTLFENERGVASKTAGTPRFSADCDNFDILGLKNAARHWFARDLMTSLGYEDWRSFTNLAAVETPWSNGQVEGQVNRLKTLKRQMYGRAGFSLLRARVLPYASSRALAVQRAP